LLLNKVLEQPSQQQSHHHQLLSSILSNGEESCRQWKRNKCTPD
jgi:hypothetical protein